MYIYAIISVCSKLHPLELKLRHQKYEIPFIVNLVVELPGFDLEAGVYSRNVFS